MNSQLPPHTPHLQDVRRATHRDGWLGLKVDRIPGSAKSYLNSHLSVGDVASVLVGVLKEALGDVLDGLGGVLDAILAVLGTSGGFWEAPWRLSLAS